VTYRQIYETQACRYGPVYIHQLTDEYKRDLKTDVFLFLSSARSECYVFIRSRSMFPRAAATASLFNVTAIAAPRVIAMLLARLACHATAVAARSPTPLLLPPSPMLLCRGSHPDPSPEDAPKVSFFCFLVIIFSK
jgi:hypothetical protein